MTWISVTVLCAFLLFKEYIHVSSTESEILLQILQFRRNITKEGHDGERGSFLSSLDNPEQVQRGFIEDKIVTTGKSVEDSHTFENPGDRKQKANNLDNILKSFEAKVYKLERKLRRKSNIVLYSSQETQNGSTGISPENENTRLTKVLSAVSEKISTKTADSVAVATSSSIVKPSFSTSVSFTFMSTTKGENFPTPSSSQQSVKQTAGVLRTTAPSVTTTFKTTPSPSVSLSTIGGNISLTKALDHSPALGDITPSISEKIKAHTTTVLSHSTIVVSEDKPATGQPLSTKISPEIELISPSIERLVPKPTEATKTNDKEETKGKSELTNQPTKVKEKKKGLFQNLSIEILIALIAGALCALLLLAFLVYRLKKRNEGSYDLSETLYMKIRTQDELGTKKEVFV